jgi:hypothetical protein
MVAHYGSLSAELQRQLAAIPPSVDGGLNYYPCQVTLSDGTQLDRVYLVEYAPYLRTWGVTPEQDRAKRSVAIEQVTAVAESPSRLPREFANELYRAGESGMGYCVFRVKFRDGRVERYVTGNAVDFISYPVGYGPEDVVAVEAHALPWEGAKQGAPYHWCIFERGGGAA